GLDDYLRADRRPIELGRIFFGEHADALAVHADGVGGGRDLVWQVAEDGVVLQKMRQRLGIGEVVDRNEFQILVGERGPQNVAADAPETIDAYFDCHFASLRTSD